MDDLDRLLAETMHSAAGRAPSDAGLLDTVHQRSRRHHRRRVMAGLGAAATVLAVGIPAVAVMTRPESAAPPLNGVPTVAAPLSQPPPPVPSAPATPSSPGLTTAAADAVTLSTGWKAPTFPYRLPVTDGMTDPVASMNDGKLIAFFEATELRYHADVTVTVSGQKPAFTTAATETARRVRGHAGTLRTVDVRPAKQLTLYWRESPSRWIQLATDDTYTPDQVVALADALTPASLAVLPPFRLDLAPTGLVTDTVTASRVTFRQPGSAPGADGFSTVLRKRRELTDTNQKIKGYDAALIHRDGSVTLAVDVTDWNATLEVTVGNGLTLSDADLLRYAAGVTILERSHPE
jgi:hypothetical protein